MYLCGRPEQQRRHRAGDAAVWSQHSAPAGAYITCRYTLGSFNTKYGPHPQYYVLYVKPQVLVVPQIGLVLDTVMPFLSRPIQVA